VPGSIIAAGAWVLMSYLFNVYVNNFSNFGLLYGSVGTLVVLMFWFYLSAIVILVGGEINEVIESAAAVRRAPGRSAPG
jgi:membrane protein